LVYTHYYGFFVLIAENLYAVTMFLLSKEDFKARIRKWLSLQFSIALLFGPWIRIFFKQVLRVQQKGEFCKSAALSPYTIYKTLYQYAGNTELLLLFFLFVFLSVLLHEEAKEMTSPKDHQVFLKGISQEATFGDANRVRGMYLLSLWLLAPILLPFAVSHFSPRFYTYKYTISASLALCLLVAKGISKIASKWLKWIAAALILVLSLVSARQYYVTVQKEEWREAAAYLDSNARSGDLALIHARFTEKAFNYYSRRADLIKKGFPSKTNLVDEKTIGELASTTKGYPRVWLILSHSRDRHGLIAKTLSKTYGLSDYEKFKGIELHLFKEKRWMKEGNAPWQGS